MSKLLRSFGQPGTLLTIPDAGSVRAAFIDSRTNVGVIVITHDGRWFQYNEAWVFPWRELPQPPEH